MHDGRAWLHGDRGHISAPFEHLTAVPLLIAALSKCSTRDSVVVAPDLGAAKLVERVALTPGSRMRFARSTRGSRCPAEVALLMLEVVEMPSRARARDLLTAPGLLSLSRVVLALLFPAIADRPLVALMILVTAGLTDIADGWIARRFGLATPTGAVLDPITDKIFVLTVAVTLIAQEKLLLGEVLLLGAREALELPLAVWLGISHRARASRVHGMSANWFGKAATCLQFATVVLVLLDSRHVQGWLLATAGVGILAAVSYWIRFVRVILRTRA